MNQSVVYRTTLCLREKKNGMLNVIQGKRQMKTLYTAVMKKSDR